MGLFTNLRRYSRLQRHRGWLNFVKRVGYVSIAAAFIAVGQGAFELYTPGAGFTDAIRSINFTWLIACTITFIGFIITSEVIWNLFGGRRAAEAALRSALKIVVRSLELDSSANVRVAIYVAGKADSRDQRVLYQHFPYVYAHKNERNYGVGRDGIAESIGIVGHVFRKEDLLGLATFVDADDAESFVKKLVDPPWNFPKKLAERINYERRSYMCVRYSCARDRNQAPLEGVVFFDAKGNSSQFTDDMARSIINDQIDVIADLISDYFRGRAKNDER